MFIPPDLRPHHQRVFPGVVIVTGALPFYYKTAPAVKVYCPGVGFPDLQRLAGRPHLQRDVA